MPERAPMDTLDHYYLEVRDIILKRQDWITGLLPASTAITSHGNYTDAWVRDNVYSILSAWGLGLAYRKQLGGSDKAYELEQSVVKLMRGLLMAMMHQADKVEKFKHTQDPLDALHAKYGTHTGKAVVGDREWGHLQLDATSLYLLMLAQMTASGLRIIFSLDEVNFVQNLVHYISRAYRTPDYGIWERGNKLNHGQPELNASSIGMAKAALEAMAGSNLFGKEGGQASIIHVISDDIARTRITLGALLPRESISKEVDAAVLSITGFPAFAVDSIDLRAKTNHSIVSKLEGYYGLKRFLLDGHQTVIEDPTRLHYEPHELKQFQDIECEWPLFFTYLLLNHLFAGDHEKAAYYRSRLDTICIQEDDHKLLPELYFVPESAIADEKLAPHSQGRLPNENIPLVWAQSLYILGCLIQEGHLELDDIDPLGRHKVKQSYADATVQVAFLAEDASVRARLNQVGLPSELISDLSPLQIRQVSELEAAYAHVGRNDRMVLTGRPLHELRTLSTSRIYSLAGNPLLFLPEFMDQKGFYLAMDNQLFISRLKAQLIYISNNWDTPKWPLLVIKIQGNMLNDRDAESLITFLKDLSSPKYKEASVKVGYLSHFLFTTAQEKIGYLHDFKFSEPSWAPIMRYTGDVLPIGDGPHFALESSEITQWEFLDDSGLLYLLQSTTNLYAQLELLSLLVQRQGKNSIVSTDFSGPEIIEYTLSDLLEELYLRAGDIHLWYVVRKTAGLLGKHDVALEQAATDIIVRQHGLSVGSAYSGKATLRRPVEYQIILEAIQTYNADDTSQQVIIQELILYLGLLIKQKPELLRDMDTIRVGHILHLIIARHKRKTNLPFDQSYNEILSMPPHEVAIRLREALEALDASERLVDQVETLHIDGDGSRLESVGFTERMDPLNFGGADDWYDWREQQGSIGRENDAFYNGVWKILHHCKGLMVGVRYNSNRHIDSNTLLSQMTAGEHTFRLHISHILNKIQAPVYRQLCVEALNALTHIFTDNETLHIDDTLVTDILIGHAVRISWLKQHPHLVNHYEESVSLAWQSFYQQAPHVVANSIQDALNHLLNSQDTLDLERA